MLYNKVHNAIIAFENGHCEQTIIEQDEYSLYLNSVNDKIYATVYLNHLQIDIGEIGNMLQSYIVITDNLKDILQCINNNLTDLQLGLSC